MVWLTLVLALMWPVPAPLSKELELPAAPWLAGHRGLDLAAGPGTAVRSPRAGTVVFAGDVAGKPVVVISHGWVRATYEPVSGVLPVGAQVTSGTVIGYVATGESHCAGQCLHWGLRAGERYLDPRLLLQTRAILRPHPVGAAQSARR